METLKIKIPKGFEVESFDTATGELKFKEKSKDIRDQIKTFSDVLKHLDIDADDFEDRIEDMTDDEAAYVKVKLIVRVLNQGWTPDWSNTSEYKYYPWFDMGSPSGVGFSSDVVAYWITSSPCGSRLCFKSRELAVHAGKTFEEIYQEYFVMG